MFARPLVLTICVWWLMCAGSAALAYCRTHTEDPAASSCPEQCPRKGQALYWAKPNLTYAFNERSFPGLTSDQMRAIFAASFQTWENVRCNDESVGLDIRALTATTTLEVGPKEDEPNQNVVLHLSSADWADEDLPSRAFAITAVWFDYNTGEILGADMMFNGGMDPFGECSPQGCIATDPHTDLRNVATHEIGHFLGLSHSDVEESTMWCDADPQEISKRSLAVDDVAGLCNIYEPGVAFMGRSATDDLDSCGVGAPGRGSLAGLSLTLLAALGLWWRRRPHRPYI